MPSEESNIKEVLLRYGDGLNKASVEQCVGLYASDGVCMPQHQPSSQGTEALKKTYTGFFNMLQFKVEFNIIEVNIVTPEWAFARTESHGTTTLVQGNGQKNNESNQELFVMQKVDNNWKIARYCFCTTNPPH